jgi:hypothetical protein
MSSDASRETSSAGRNGARSTASRTLELASAPLSVFPRPYRWVCCGRHLNQRMCHARWIEVGSQPYFVMLSARLRRGCIPARQATCPERGAPDEQPGRFGSRRFSDPCESDNCPRGLWWVRRRKNSSNPLRRTDRIQHRPHESRCPRSSSQRADEHEPADRGDGLRAGFFARRCEQCSYVSGE